MRITKLQSILTLSLTLVVGFASGFVARDYLPQEKASIETPKITFNSHMPEWTPNAHFGDFACPASAFFAVTNLLDDIFRETLHPFTLTHPFFSTSSSLALASAPEIDLKQTDDQLQVVLSRAGLKPSDVNVFVEGNKLVINGHHRQQSKNGFREESFMRAVDVPYGVDLSKIKKHYANGALTVTVPRANSSDKSISI